VTASRLQSLVQRAQRPRPAGEQCDLCAEPLAESHRHLLEVRERRLLCACRACAVLFDRSGAGGGHYRLIPDRSVLLDDFDLGEVEWRRLGIPVDMAFFFHSSPAGRVVAFYPSPLGATESLLELEAWDDVVTSNPRLLELEPDVEALFVNRARGKREHWILPVDRCYELVGVVRRYWRGFGGGEEVWTKIDQFFAERRRDGAQARKA
jgi:hypothetical protein